MAFAGETADHLRSRQARGRVAPVGCNLGNGLQHKQAISNARVRQYQMSAFAMALLTLHAVIINDVEIESAWAPARAALAPGGAFDALQERKQRLGR